MRGSFVAGAEVEDSPLIGRLFVLSKERLSQVVDSREKVTYEETFLVQRRNGATRTGLLVYRRLCERRLVWFVMILGKS